MRKIIFLLVFFIIATAVQAQVQTDQEPLVFESAAQQKRFEKLTAELRCLVCQNQNLADSDAPLAHDLRSQVHRMMLAGQSDAEIKQFLLERYGDFVLYRPPLQGNTLVLWFAPVVLLLLGGTSVWFTIRKRNRLLTADTSLADSDHNDVPPEETP